MSSREAHDQLRPLAATPRIGISSWEIPQQHATLHGRPPPQHGAVHGCPPLLDLPESSKIQTSGDGSGDVHLLFRRTSGEPRLAYRSPAAGLRCSGLSLIIHLRISEGARPNSPRRRAAAPLNPPGGDCLVQTASSSATTTPTRAKAWPCLPNARTGTYRHACARPGHAMGTATSSRTAATTRRRQTEARDTRP